MRAQSTSLAGGPRIFYGWWIVLASALGGLLGPGPIVTFSFGVFVTPLGREFHAGRGAIALAISLLNLALAGSCPLAGRLADRYGARKIILLSTLAFGATLVSCKLVTAKLGQLYAFYLVLGFLSSGAVVLYSKVISQWFDRRRGLALGLMMCGFGLGAIAMPPLQQRLIAASGWRTAYEALGAAVLLVAVPVIAAFLKERPEAINLLPDGNSPDRPIMLGETASAGLSWHDAWRSQIFWIMLGAFCLAAASVHACFIHMPAMLAGRGATAEAAALASSVLGAGMMAARLFAGYLFDRFFAPYVAAVFFSALAFGIALLRLTSAIEVAFFAAFLVGMSLGAEGDAIAYLTSRYFGLRSFGEIYGYAWGAFILAGAFGAYLTGAGFDRTGSYGVPLVAFFTAALIAALLMTRLGPYRYRAPSAEAPQRMDVAG